MSAKGPAIVDVTLREAGIANGFSFSLDQVAQIASTLDRAGIDVLEAGYAHPAPAGAPASGESCGPEYLSVVRKAAPRARLAVMVHPAEVPPQLHASLAAQGVDMVRFTVSGRTLDALPRHVEAARAAGLAVAVNAVRVTEQPPAATARCAQLAERLGASCFFVADSNGGLYPDQLAELLHAVRREAAIPLGIHAHDNLRLAFANALVGLRHGCEYVDASLGGAGKGGGNLATELIAGHLALGGGRPYDAFALWSAYQAAVAPTLSTGGHSPLCLSLHGLLDLNVDRVAELSRQAAAAQVPVERLLEELYRARIAAAAAPEGRTIEEDERDDHFATG